MKVSRNVTDVRREGGQPEVDAARCTGCGRCVAACPERLFTLEVSGFRKHALLGAPTRCNRCLECLAACPVGALGCGTPTGAPEK